MKTWKLAIAGCGNWAEHTLLPDLTTREGIQVSALYNRTIQRARRLGQQYGIGGIYSDLDSMLEQADFDILLDFAAIPVHYDINRKALLAGKHVYSEKPFAQTVAQATELIELAEQKGLILSTAPAHMAKPEMRAIKQLLDTGAIGKISLMRCSSSHGGPEYFQFREDDPGWFYQPGAGALMDMGVHGLHRITGLLGPAKSVACTAAVSEPRRTVRSGLLDGNTFDANHIPDNYIITLDFGSGTLAVLCCGYVQKASLMNGFEIYGNKGTISTIGCADHPPGFQVYCDDSSTGLRGWLSPMSSHEKQRAFREADAVLDLIAALEEGRPPLLSARHSRHVIEIMQAVPQALESGGPVYLETMF